MTRWRPWPPSPSPLRSAIRGPLKVADEDLEHELRDMPTSGDENDSAAQP